MNNEGSKGDQPNTSAPPKETPSQGRRNFIKYTGAGVAGFVVATAIEYPLLNNQIQQDNSKISSLQDQVTSLNGQINTLNGQITSLNNQINADQQQISSLQTQVTTGEGFLTLGINEAKELEAIVETIIPSDASGPGAKEAGVIYFIDRQLATDYGKSANMYMKGPFVMAGQGGPLTVDGITYPQGSPSVPFSAGTRYQYSMQMKDFWKYGLAALQSYSNSAYGGNFETLSASQKVQALTDLYDNKPSSFNGIVPQDFFNELIFMTWSGFHMDPLYGGNRQMVGWILTGFNGPNMGDFYNEGYQVTQLMVSNKPIRLRPASLGQYQQKLGLSVGG